MYPFDLFDQLQHFYTRFWHNLDETRYYSFWTDFNMKLRSNNSLIMAINKNGVITNEFFKWKSVFEFLEYPFNVAFY